MNKPTFDLNKFEVVSAAGLISMTSGLKWIWDQDDSINTELEIEQIAELEVSSELTTI